jgi:hypothetical protein
MEIVPDVLLAMHHMPKGEERRDSGGRRRSERVRY